MEAVVRQVNACRSTRRHRRRVASCRRPRPRRSAVDLPSDAVAQGPLDETRRRRRSARCRSFAASDVVGPSLDRARSSDQDFARAPRCARLHRLRAAAVTPMRRAPGGRTERPSRCSNLTTLNGHAPASRTASTHGQSPPRARPGQESSRHRRGARISPERQRRLSQPPRRRNPPGVTELRPGHHGGAPRAKP